MDAVDTLVMPDEDWVNNLAAALGKVGAEHADAEPAEPGIAPEVPASQPEPPMPEEVEDIPPTQPDPDSPPRYVLNGPYDTSPEEPEGGQDNGKETKEDKEVKKPEPPVDVRPEDPPDFPMVSRESQQTFKNSKGQVEKMDAASRGDEVRKRPAANKAKAKAKRTKQDKLAKPVTPGREDGEEVEPKNLNADFDAAASDIIEVEDEGTEEKTKRTKTIKGKGRKDDNEKEQEPAKRPRRSTTSTRSTGSDLPEAKAKAEAKSRARKVPKTAETPKDVEKKGSKKKPAAAKDKSDLPDEVPSEKKTFAGRRCPTTDLYAKGRFIAMKTIYNRHILTRVKSMPSNVEAWCSWKTFLTPQGISNPKTVFFTSHHALSRFSGGTLASRISRRSRPPRRTTWTLPGVWWNLFWNARKSVLCHTFKYNIFGIFWICWVWVKHKRY